MTFLKYRILIGNIIQAGIGVYVILWGYRLSHRVWDRSHAEELTGKILMVLGMIILLMLRMR